MDSEGKKCADCRWWDEFNQPSYNSGEWYSGPPNGGMHSFTNKDEWCDQFLPPEHILEAAEKVLRNTPKTPSKSNSEPLSGSR